MQQGPCKGNNLSLIYPPNVLRIDSACLGTLGDDDKILPCQETDGTHNTKDGFAFS